MASDVIAGLLGERLHGGAAVGDGRLDDLPREEPLPVLVAAGLLGLVEAGGRCDALLVQPPDAGVQFAAVLGPLRHPPVVERGALGVRVYAHADQVARRAPLAALRVGELDVAAVAVAVALPGDQVLGVHGILLA